MALILLYPGFSTAYTPCLPSSVTAMPNRYSEPAPIIIWPGSALIRGSFDIWIFPHARAALGWVCLSSPLFSALSTPLAMDAHVANGNKSG